jgi:hypothetical protein
MSMTVSERNRADAYAGPGKSYPLYSTGKHLRAAWDLAGRAADPDAVRAKVMAFAKKHGLTHLLPKTALGTAKKAIYSFDEPYDPDEGTPEAGGSKAARLLSLAWHHESMEGDTPEKERLIAFAQSNGLSDALPPEAHGFMHEHDIPHGHPDDEYDGAPSEHSHPVQKAINVVAKQFIIQKAWDGPTEDSAIIEGWTSTEDPDMEKDVVPPECFETSLGEYMARKGPLTSEHDTRGYPIGHAQRVALVRDGKIFKSATHPDDPAEFEHFPQSGTGMYGRYIITDPVAATAVKKGNVGGFSWIGNLKRYEPLPGGGRRFLLVDPLRENTVAAYPVNSKAVLMAVKAFQADLEAAEGDTELMGKLEELLEGAAQQIAAEEAAKKANQTISKADLAILFQELETKVLSAMDEKVQKALPVTREEGVGRAGIVETPQSEREANPVAYIVKAMQSGQELSQADKELAWGITYQGLSRGMSAGDGE